MRILALVSLVVFPAFGAIRSVTPDMYGGQADSWAIKRNSEKLAIATNIGAKVVYTVDVSWRAGKVVSHAVRGLPDSPGCVLK